MKKVLLAASVVLLLIFAVILTPHIRADDTNCNCKDLGCLDQLNTCLNNLNNALSMSVNATRPLESQLTSLQNQIAGIKASIANIEDDIFVKREQIDKGYKDLAAKQLILNAKIRDLYIKNFFNSPLTLFLTSGTANEWTQRLAYQKAVADQDKLIITNIALSVDALQTQKTRLEQQETQLTSMKATLDDQSAKLDKVVSDAKAYQAKLSDQIAQLSAQQQNLLAQKYASLNISSSAYNMSGGCKSDLATGTDPGFSPKIGLFTYGVPHRIGMNQFGAKGRADSGKSYKDILNFYYPNTQISSVDQGQTIHVVGTNEYGQTFNGDDGWNLETYVKHLYEMPTNWSMDALRAQAIAARSYALATKTTINGVGDAVCPSQSCQVVKKEINDSRWQQAVDDTAGQVLTYNGQPIQAYFSSTAGGYTFTTDQVWHNGTKPWTQNIVDADGSVNSFSDLQSKAYDGPSHGNSNWFYCDWGSRSSSNGTAWLRPSEMADIANVVKLAQITNQDQNVTKHLLQLDKSNPDGNWDEAQVRQELQNRGVTPFTSVSGANVSANFGSGIVTNVTINGDAGSMNFNGDFFKTYFNLRAPANIQIVGPLFNIEIR